MRYFVAGNFWLFVSVAVFLLAETERTGPKRVSLLGIGTWLSPFAYNVIALLLFLIACAFLGLSWRSSGRNDRN